MASEMRVQSQKITIDTLLAYPQLNILLKDIPAIRSIEFDKFYYESMEVALNYLLQTDCVGDSGYIELYGEHPIGPLGIDWQSYIISHPNVTVIEALAMNLVEISAMLGCY